jgi:hypothetical protein
VGTLHLGYVDATPPFTYLTRRAGGAWSNGSAIPLMDPPPSESLAFAAGADGKVVAAYQAGHNGRAAVASLGAGAMGEIVDKAGQAAELSIARDAFGGTHVVYSSAEDYHLHYAYRCE